MQFNLGIGLSPIATASKLSFDPPRVLEALRRGTAMTADLTDGSWDYWADMPLSLDIVRFKYGVPPLREPDTHGSVPG